MTLSWSSLATFLSALGFEVLPFAAGLPSGGESPALSRLEGMRREKRRERTESFLLVQLLLTAVLSLVVLFIERVPLIEDLLGCGSEHVLHRSLDRRALPRPHGAHRGSPCRPSSSSSSVVVKITERSGELPDSETMNSLTGASCLMMSR
jgi:hypothetical protein